MCVYEGESESESERERESPRTDKQIDVIVARQSDNEAAG